MKKLYFVMALLVVASMILTACGSPATTAPAVDQQFPASVDQSNGWEIAEGYDAVLTTGITFDTGDQVGATTLTTIFHTKENLTAPALIKIEMKLRGKNYDLVPFSPGSQSILENANPTDYEIISISADGWVFDKNEEADGVWYGKRVIK